MDAMDEARACIPDYLEMDGAHVALTEVMADDNLRARAIEMLNAKLEPYTDKDFPPEIMVAWITWLYLQVKDSPNSRKALELVLRKSKNPERLFKVVH